MSNTYTATFIVSGKTYRTKIPNCMNKTHALAKLKSFINKNYGFEYVVLSCEIEVTVDYLKDLANYAILTLIELES